ncbi:MAG TPA: ATP synthase F1 subunit gamma, partial [Candidatus Saccharimonadales bacterium]|nr:ATP synthase F1 subunit gamma [Candidatus Saccharimonadales bacterium]
VNTHPLFTKRAVKTRLYVVITSNRGLAGAYNANIMRLLARSVLKDREEHIKSRVVAIGKQGANFVRRLEGVELVAAYSAFSDHPTANELRPVLNMVVEMYQTEAVDDVKLLYTKFKSNIVQEAKRLAILPTRFEPEEGEAPDQGQDLGDVTFEPSVTSVLDNVAVRLIEVQIWQAMLESIASEHSMRMLAMKNATDNASELIDDLTLEFNTARQAAITQELAEITGGAEAIQQ